MHSLSDLSEDPFQADLHCHTIYSDGSLDPKEIIDLAIKIGLSALVITDHDTEYAKEKNFILGTGVEFSCDFNGHSVHVLGYDFSLSNERFLDYCNKQQKKRLYRNRDILEKLKHIKMEITEEDLLALHHKASTWGRPHIAAIMLSKGYVKSIQEAFQVYLGDNGYCFVPGEAFPIAEALSVIHEAGGKAFIAHPHMYNNANLVKEVLTFPFDGIECFYGRISREKTKRWRKLAKYKGLLISGGSDFHGDAKPYISLGSSWVNREIFYSIFEKNLV